MGSFWAERVWVTQTAGSMGTFCSRKTLCRRAYGRPASLDLPDSNFAPNGFRRLTLITEAEAEATVQREWEARTTQWEETGRRGQPT